jgi:hypothetical protein
MRRGSGGRSWGHDAGDRDVGVWRGVAARDLVCSGVPVTRRQWLAGVGALGAASQLPGCAGAPDVTGLVVEVEPTRALVAAWADGVARGEVAVTTADGVMIAAAPVDFDDLGHAVLDVAGLTPATRYLVTISAGGGGFGPIRFVTAPADDDPRPQRLVVTADVDDDRAYDSPIFTTLAALEPDLCVSLGDWPYVDNAPAPADRAGIEERYLASRRAPRFQPWLTATSFRAIYDDHEFGNDWDGAARAAYPDHEARALAAWDAWFPRRGDGPRYRRWRWGASLECFLLDTRGFRSANADPDGPSKTLLGEAQRRWLIDGVLGSTAPFKLVLSSVPLDFGHGDDHWSSFADERGRVFGALADAGVTGLLVVSADQHWFAAHRHARGLREFQFGPVSRGVITPPAPAPGVLVRVQAYNVGVLEVTAEPRLRIRAVDATGATLYDEAFTPADLALA